jgi:hypothetical protein
VLKRTVDPGESPCAGNGVVDCGGRSLALPVFILSGQGASSERCFFFFFLPYYKIYNSVVVISYKHIRIDFLTVTLLIYPALVF